MTVAASPERAPQVRCSDASAHSSALAPCAFANLLRGQQIAEVTVTASAAMPDCIGLVVDDDRRLSVVAQALPANGRPVEAALTAEIARGPLDADAIDPGALADALRRRIVQDVTLTGHPGTASAYHLLIATDAGEQIAIQAHALPADAGSPVLRFDVCGAENVAEAIAVFDETGELVG
jgi:hypothetical protein